MIDLEKLKRAIEIQKEIIINDLIKKSENGIVLTDDELDMLETYYEENVED